MNIRANIMYFLEYLCDMAARENHWDYEESDPERSSRANIRKRASNKIG